jgi:glycosyltransferase involved in cell wall biosynthesis
MQQPNRIACFFSTSGHSGVDRAMKHLIPEMARRGYLVDLLHIENHGPYLEDVPAGVRIVKLGTKSTYPSLFPLIRYLRREKPAVLLSDKDRVNRTALFAKWLSGTKPYQVLRSGTTISIDLANRGWFERWVQRNSMGKLYPYANRVITPSRGAADDMAAYTGLDRAHIEVAASPVIADDSFDKTYARPEHSWFKQGELPIILGVGELSPRKDFSTLIQAFAKVRQKKECRLVILGKGKQKEELEQLAVTLGVSDDVALLGFKSNPYDYMAYASVFALTSLWEGLGFVLIEALAMGTPVVSTDCPSGPAEILNNGEFGELVPMQNPEALALSILKTLEQPLAHQTLQQAAKPYSVSSSTTAYLKAFNLPAQWNN